MAIIDSAYSKISFQSVKFAQQANANKKSQQFKAQIKHIENTTSSYEESIEMDEKNGNSANNQTVKNDEMSSLITMFRQRREWEKKSALNSESSFEQILDDGDTLSKMQQFIKLTNVDTTMNLKTFLLHLEQLFPDESDMFLVLKELLRRKSISAQFKAKLTSAINYVESNSNPKKRKSGINIALKARLFATPLDIKPAIIRQTYRRFLEDEQDTLDIYYQWIIEFGYSKRSIVLDFMETALLTDMLSLDPSCSRNEFGHLLGRVKQLNILHSTEALFLKQVNMHPSLKYINHDALAWFEFLADSLRQPKQLPHALWVLSGTKLQLIPHRERGEILQIIFKLIMNIPNELYQNIEYKTQLYDAFLQLGHITFQQQKNALKDQSYS